MRHCQVDRSRTVLFPLVEPIHPLERRKLHGFIMPPRTTATDELGLIQPDDRLGQGILVRIAAAADRGINARFGEPLSVANRKVLHPPAVMNKRRPLIEGPVIERLGRAQD